MFPSLVMRTAAILLAAAVSTTAAPQVAAASETTAATASPAVTDTFSSLSSSGSSWAIPQAPDTAPDTQRSPEVTPEPGHGETTITAPEETLPATPMVTIDQGDKFITDRGNSCTIGYIDKVQGVAYTAFHCGKDHMDNRRAVYVRRDGVKIRVGTMVHAHRYLPEVGLLPPEVLENETTTARDIAAIKFDSNVILGDNIYSGDTRIPIDQVTEGETACLYGVKTGKSVCGTVRNVFGGDHPEHRIVVTLPNAAIALPGDSGGVAYIPGRGSIGIVKGSWEIPARGIGGFAATGY